MLEAESASPDERQSEVNSRSRSRDTGAFTPQTHVRTLVCGPGLPDDAQMGVPASEPAVRVLVVDDSLAFREAAHELIDGADEFAWAGEACSGEEGIDAALRLRPDLVLMDVRMPGIGGIGAAARIASHALPPVVILVTGADLPTEVPDATAAEILAKHLVCRESLKRLWEDHAPR